MVDTVKREDVEADLRHAVAELIMATTHLGDAILGAQTVGLGAGVQADLRGHFAVLRRRADEMALLADSLASPAPKLELIPGGITSQMCSECGRIGDHSTTCPEVER